MEKRLIYGNMVHKFELKLKEEERCDSTVEKYLREVTQFREWLGEEPVTKELVSAWKEALVEEGYQPSTVNGKVAALNRFFDVMGWEDCKVKALKIQRKLFRDERRELTKAEYEQLLKEAARQGKERLELLMETICATGIRVSEVRYITMEAIRQNRAEVHLKGKIRVIMIPGKLCRKLLKYAKKQKIQSGELFVTRRGQPLSRKQIWAEMKALCQDAGVEASKVFPHNLRHLFARCFYKVSRDISRLADVLGHSSVETTRIYLISSGLEHAHTLEQLNLIL